MTVSIAHVTTDNANFSAMSLKELIFSDGETNKGYSFAITNDNNDENDETFNLALSNLQNCGSGNINSVTVTINDDDTSPTGGNNNNPPKADSDSGGGSQGLLILFVFLRLVYRRRNFYARTNDQNDYKSVI